MHTSVLKGSKVSNKLSLSHIKKEISMFSESGHDSEKEKGNDSVDNKEFRDSQPPLNKKPIGSAIKWKNRIWPVIVDGESAEKAARQGFWAAIFAAIINFTFVSLEINGSGALVDAAFFAVIAFGLYKMSRSAAVLGIVYYFLTRAGWWSYRDWQNVWLAGLISLMFINSIRGTFAYHKLKMASPRELSSPSKATTLSRNLDPIIVVLAIIFLFWSYAMFNEMDQPPLSRTSNALAPDQISLSSKLPPAGHTPSSPDSVPVEKETMQAGDYFDRGNANLEKGKYTAAIEHYNKAISLNLKNAWIYSYRGYAYYMRGQYDKAILDYTKAIELKPNYVTNFYYRGNAYAAIGNVEKAVPDFEKACEGGWADGCKALNSISKKR
jgi:hypothetical protein